MKTARFLAIAFAFSMLARAERDVSPAMVKVRLTKLPSDLRIRLLLNRVAKNGGPSFTISGFRLRDSLGRVIPNDSVKCEEISKKIKLPQGRFHEESTGRWVCRSGMHYELAVSDGVRIYPEGGFIEYGGKSYRGGIEFAEIAGQIQILNSVELEKYLVGLLTKEMNPDFPLEALKAQAVAARSYAIARAADQRRAGKKWDLMVTPEDQVYTGAHTEDPRTLVAVKATLGEALFFRDDVITAYYHASSGGYLETPENLWGKTALLADRLAYAAQDNPWDRGTLEWSVTISPDIGGMWPDVGVLQEVTVTARTSGHRVDSMVLKGASGQVILAAADIRRRFGNDLIKSLNFTVEALPSNAGWKITGHGWGHGVGLSQWAAKAMAEAGMSYRSILKFHYPFADVKLWIPRKTHQPNVDDLQPVPAALTR